MKEDSAYVCSMGYPALTVFAERLYDLASNDTASVELYGIGFMLEALAEKMKRATENSVV